MFENAATGTVEVVAGDVAIMNGVTSSGTWRIGNAATDAPCTNPTELAALGTSAGPRLHLRAGSFTVYSFLAGSITGPGCLSVAQSANATVAAAVPITVGGIGIVSGTLNVAGDRTLPDVKIGNSGTLNVNSGTATMAGSIGQTTPGQLR